MGGGKTRGGESQVSHHRRSREVPNGILCIRGISIEEAEERPLGIVGISSGAGFRKETINLHGCMENLDKVVKRLQVVFPGPITSRFASAS